MATEPRGEPKTEPAPSIPLAFLRSRVRPSSRHDCLPSALEAAAREDALRLTVHGGKDPARANGVDLLEGAWRVAALLQRHGVRRGDPVPIAMPTSVETVQALLGAMMAGAVPAPLATPMTFGAADRFVDHLEAVVRDSGATVAFAAPRLREAMARNDALSERLQVVLQPEDVAMAPAATAAAPSIGSRDPGLLQYTSGTTGRPKGVLLSHEALVSNAFAVARGLELEPDDVGVSWLPLFHDMGLVGVLLTAICYPYALHLLRPELFLMRPRRWLTTASEVGATLSAAPNFAYELAVARGGEPDGLHLDDLRAALDGAEPVHARTLERFQQRFAPAGLRPDVLMPVYGMAEHTLAVTFPELDNKQRTLRVDADMLQRRGLVQPSVGRDVVDTVSVGGPVAGTSVRVVDGSRDVLPEGVVGEIQVIGTCRMIGYWNDERATANALDDEWLRTGDLGFVYDGDLFVIGRAKDVIIKGGRNIHPHDVEHVVSEAGDGWTGAAAVGRENPRTGTEDLIVVVETRSADEAERVRIEKTIRGEVLASLDASVDEVHVWPVGTIPRTTSGKIRRAECVRRLSGKEPR